MLIAFKKNSHSWIYIHKSLNEQLFAKCDKKHLLKYDNMMKLIVLDCYITFKSYFAFLLQIKMI